MHNYGVRSMARYVGYGMRASMMMPTFGYGGGGNGSIAAVCHRVAYYEMTRGHGRGGYERYVKAFGKCVQDAWPTWAEGAGKGSGSGNSATPAQGAQRPSSAQRAQQNQKTKSSGKKESPEEAERKKEEATKKARIKAAESALNKYKKNAVSALVSKKGYPTVQAEEIVKVIDASVKTDHGGDPDKAEAAVTDYTNYHNTVPHGKIDKSTNKEYEPGKGKWERAYTEWLAGMKKISPPERALHAIGDVRRMKGKTGFDTKKTPKYAALERIGTKKDASGNTYDAFEVVKSGDSRVPRESIVVRRKGKWYTYEAAKVVTPLKVGRRDPKFDAKLGILDLERNRKKLGIKIRDGLDAKAINDSVESWMKKRPTVASKKKVGEERAKSVKEAIETKLKAYFGGKKLVSVTTDGRDVKIAVEGADDAERNANARKVVRALEHNDAYFCSVFDDMVLGSSFSIAGKHRIAARDTTTFDRVVGALRKLPTKTKVRTLDVREFDRRGGDVKPAYADMEARVQHLPNAVAGKEVVVTLRFIDGYAPDKTSDDWKNIVKLIKAKYHKKDRTVEVKQETVEATIPAGYTAARADLKARITAALWDGNKRSKRKAGSDADKAIKSFSEGATRRTAKERKTLAPISVDALKERAKKSLRIHADNMRAGLLEAKRKYGTTSKTYTTKLAEYKSWYADAEAHLGPEVAKYYDPSTVEKETARGLAVTPTRRVRRGRGPTRRVRRKVNWRKGH